MGSNRSGIEPSFDAFRALGGRIAGRVRRRRKREATLESRCVDYAKARGWVSRKMSGLGFVAWPDRLFIPPRPKISKGRVARVLVSKVFFVEFKRRGEPLTPGQREMRSDLIARGQLVYDVDTFDGFLNVFTRFHPGS